MSNDLHFYANYNYNDKKISETEIFSWIEVNEKEASCMIAGEGISRSRNSPSPHSTTSSPFEQQSFKKRKEKNNWRKKSKHHTQSKIPPKKIKNKNKNTTLNHQLTLSTTIVWKKGGKKTKIKKIKNQNTTLNHQLSLWTYGFERMVFDPFPELTQWSS